MASSCHVSRWFVGVKSSRLVSIKDEHARLVEESQAMKAKNEALEVRTAEEIKLTETSEKQLAVVFLGTKDTVLLGFSAF